MKNNKLILNTQQRFRSVTQISFTKEINKITLTSNGDERTQSISSIETYAYGTRKDLVWKKEEIKCSLLSIQNINIWRYWIWKKNALLNLISHQPDIKKNYLSVKDTYEAKYQFLINKCEKTGSKHSNNSKAFIEFLNDMDDNYKNIE